MAGVEAQATVPAFISPKTMRVGSMRPRGVWIASNSREGPGSRAYALYMLNLSVHQYREYPGSLASSSVPLAVVGNDFWS